VENEATTLESDREMTSEMPTIVDEICDLCMQSAPEMSWLIEPLTPGRARAYVLQHILRNRLLSAVIRPAWLSRCPDMVIVEKTIDQMREELVHDDVIGRAHTDLLKKLGHGVGLSDAEMDSSTAVPLVEAAFNLWENLARTRHWAVGFLSSSVGEYLIVTLKNNNFSAARWKQTMGLNDEDVFFFSYHEKADLLHAGVNVWKPIIKHIHDEKDRQELLSGAKMALEALRLFYRGVADLGDELDQKLQEKKRPHLERVS
jgi:pyrroloquinoline quinone (PQQ) biosynthesis protein C